VTGILFVTVVMSYKYIEFQTLNMRGSLRSIGRNPLGELVGN